MSMDHFVTGQRPPFLMRDLAMIYMVSGKPLDVVETVQVVVRLPYCLYVPSIRYVFHSPSDDVLVGIVPEKVWTGRAEGSTILDTELVMHDESVYLDKSELITDWVGQPKPFTGDIQGRNIEFERDPTGYFRYTRLTVEFDWYVPCGYNPSAKKGDENYQENEHQIITQISTLTLPFVNHFIDVYRVTTDDIYLERIPTLRVDDIRIGIHDGCSIRKHEKYPGGPFTYKYGYHPNMLGTHGVRSAMVSKPKEVIDSFQSLLESGFRPATDELLRQNAFAALERHDSKLAVTESFTSLEVYVERFYYDRLSQRMTPTELADLLNTEDNWRLVVRLKELLREYFGKAVSDIDNRTWERWLDGQRQRHGIVHRNLVPSEEDARNVLQLNESIKQALEKL